MFVYSFLAWCIHRIAVFNIVYINSIRELEKQVKLAIKDWLEAETITNEERQELESLKMLVSSRDFFFKTQADSITDKFVNKGFESHMASVQGCMFEDLGMELQKAFKAGIQYALKAQMDGE